MRLFACLVIPLIVISLPLLGFFFRFYRTCLKARHEGIELPFRKILRIYWETHKPNRLMVCYTMASREGLETDISEIESLLLTGVDPEPIIQAIRMARESHVDLSWKTACAFQMIRVDFSELIHQCKHRNASPEEIQWEMRQEQKDEIEEADKPA